MEYCRADASDTELSKFARPGAHPGSSTSARTHAGMPAAHQIERDVPGLSPAQGDGPEWIKRWFGPRPEHDCLETRHSHGGAFDLRSHRRSTRLFWIVNSGIALMADDSRLSHRRRRCDDTQRLGREFPAVHGPFFDRRIPVIAMISRASGTSRRQRGTATYGGAPSRCQNAFHRRSRDFSARSSS